MLIKYSTLLFAFVFLTQVAQASIWDDITDGWNSGTADVKCFFGDEDNCKTTENPPDNDPKTRPPSEAPTDIPAQPTDRQPPNREPTQSSPPSPPPSNRPVSQTPPPPPPTPTAERTSARPERTSTDERPPRVTFSDVERPSPSATNRGTSTLTESRSTMETLSTTISVTAGGVSSTGDASPPPPPPDSGPKAGVVAAGVVIGVLVVAAMLIGAFFLVRKRNAEREANMAQQRVEQASFGRVEKV